MKKIEIHVPSFTKTYPVVIGTDIIKTIADTLDFQGYSSLFVFTDSNVEKHYLKPLKTSIRNVLSEKSIYHFNFDAGEKNKKMETVIAAYQALADAKADRRTLMICLGGGVVSDMGGFIASTYLRGIPYISIPTTLESMVDASVGGKTGVNLGGFKNYIGVFSSPQAVVMDVSTLKSLPERTFVQGYAEVIKHGLIKDEAYFTKVFQKKPLAYSEPELIDIIAESVRIKADIVQQDPHEKGIRKILNFGHTVGHVIESLSLETKNPLYHGEAVAIGMVAEAYISMREGMITEEEFAEIEQSIKIAGLPARFQTHKSVEDIFLLLSTDKKTEKGSIKWSLLSAIGKAEFNIVVNDSFAKEGIEYILTR